MASITQSGAAPGTARASRAAYPPGGLAFDWAFIGLSVVFMAGLWVDAWAHFHGQVDDSFFTPWHFLFYSAFGLTAVFTGWQQWRGVSRGHAFARALPQGYWLSLLGVALFAVGGVGDMIWHTLFGIEDGSEALTSPTHILLAIGMGLVFTGPLRAAWARAAGRGWRALGPAILGVTLVVTLAAFFTSYAHPVLNPIMARRFNGSQDLGVISVLWQAGVLAVGLLALVWRWRLPFGTFTLFFTASTALLTLLNDFYVLIVPAFIAGLLVDIVYRWLQPAADRPARLHAFAFLALAAYFGAFFAAIQLMLGIDWSIHVWTGAISLSGLTALLLSAALHGMYNAGRRAEPTS